MAEAKILSDDDKDLKIQSLRDMITTAEQTMQSAKAMLLQLEGKKKVGRRKKVEDEGDGNVVQGTFDGQIMIGTDGKQYPIPANYASKSKLVEGDFLKLTIVGNGQFIYKQIGPVPRQNKIGIVGQDASGNYFVAVDGKPYKVLLASITYFDVQPGDQVAIVTSPDENAQWASIEALLQHSDNQATPAIESLNYTQPTPDEGPKTANAILTGSTETTSEMLDEKELSNATDLTDDTDSINENENLITIENDSAEDTPSAITFIDDKGSDIIDETNDDIADVSTTEELSTEEPTSEEPPTEEPTSDDIVDEWVPNIDAIEKEIRAEMQKTD
ncbi:MAG: hypothetical protein ACKUBY_01025 [Candidatus Moraniibacteriota bacterium]|jgi:hypothetical protein